MLDKDFVNSLWALVFQTFSYSSYVELSVK